MDTIRRVRLGVMLLLPACASTPPRTDDASVDVVDASTDVRVACPEGTCVYPGSDLCRLPGGPMSGCCGCTAGVCSIECRCMAPDTPIATPTGDRRIDAIAVGDLVYGLLAGRITAVPVVEVRHTVAVGHHVQRITLVSGAVLEGSAGHPTADAKTFRDLREGDWLGGLMVLAVETVAFVHEATWDILPASDGGAYFANGALIGSTLHARVGEPVCPRVHALDERRAAPA